MNNFSMIFWSSGVGWCYSHQTNLLENGGEIMLTTLSPALNWAVIGLVLLGFELFTGTFVLLFFAVGAFFTALLTWIGLLESQAVQVVVFTILSGGGLLAFKDKLRRGWGGKAQELHGDVGASIMLDADIPLHGTCEVQYQGSRWIAVNESGRALVKGESARVARTDGVKLILK